MEVGHGIARLALDSHGTGAYVALGFGARAQDFPSRPITFVIPLGAGGVMDVIARVIGPKLTERLGRTVVIENRTGGGTVIGAQAVARAAPDGHTLLFAPSGTLTTNVALYKSLPYDPVKDFVPIALYAKIPFVLVVHPSLQAHSIGDLVKLAKTKNTLLCLDRHRRGAAHGRRAAQEHDRHRDDRMSPIAA